MVRVRISRWRCQSLAGDVFHDEVWGALLVEADIIELHDGRMRELADNLRFMQEFCSRSRRKHK